MVPGKASSRTPRVRCTGDKLSSPALPPPPPPRHADTHTRLQGPRPQRRAATGTERRYVPWPLWLTSLAAMTLFMTVCRKSFSPATLGEKRDDMLSGLCRVASSNASLEGTGRARPQETKGTETRGSREQGNTRGQRPRGPEGRHESTQDRGRETEGR